MCAQKKHIYMSSETQPRQIIGISLKFVWLTINNKITTAKEKNKQQNFSWLNKIQTKVQIAAAATTTKPNQNR